MGKVKVAFIGVGGIATAHLNNIAQNEQADIVAVCDISQENAQKQGKAFSAKSYTNYKDMLNQEKLDAIYVCVPPFAHGDIEENIVEKGIHLLVEKPIELNLDKAVAKSEVIRASGVINASGYCLRYLDTVQKAKSYLADKQIAMVRGHYISGFVDTPWYRVQSQSGGQLVEQATHTLDTMSYLAGDIKQVYADMSLKVMHDIDHIDIPDVTSVNVTFESGAVGHLDSSFTQPDHRMGAEFLGRDFRVELNGTDLTIIEKGQTIHHQSKVNFLEEEDRLFIEAVRTNNQDLIHASYEDGVKTLAVSLAANHSHMSNEIVRLDTFK